MTTDGKDPGPMAASGANPAPAGADTRRFGFVAIIGAPNAGKSTLVNALVGTKVSIVSHKVQTTRMRVRGIAIEGASQLVFVDTPGIFRPKRRLDRAMVEAAWGGAAEADIVVLVIDAARGLGQDVEDILLRLGTSTARRILVLNKVDRLPSKDVLLAQTARLLAETSISQIFMVSALKGDGITELRQHLAGAVPEGPWHYDEDDITDLPMRLAAAEITREQIFERLHEELPYAITVETLSWKELRDGSVRVEQTIFVERDGQKKIVIGKGGETIKHISSAARRELGSVLDRKVHLFLFVKVRENWGDDPERYRELGLDFPKN